MGISATTDRVIHRLDDGRYEARIGVSIMGSTNMNESEFKACNYNPFHDEFRDNYAVGVGITEAEAIQAMEKDGNNMAESLWI